jgi:hypothetical protein
VQLAVALYRRERFPDRQVPDARMFPALFQHLRDYGFFNVHTVAAHIGSKQSDRRLEADEDVLDAVAQTPGIGTRRLAIQQALPQNLNEQGLHPYHV